MIGAVVLSVFPLMALAMVLRAVAGWGEVGDKRFLGALAGGGLGAAGFAILIVRALLEVPVSPDLSRPLAIAVSMLVAPPVEEALKGAAILLVASVLPWEGRRVGLVVGAIAGLAFAMTENVHYFVRAAGALSTHASGSVNLGPSMSLVWFAEGTGLGRYVLERLLLVSVMHGVCGSWLGAALTGTAPLWSTPLLLGALGAAMFLHAGWNAMVWLGMTLPMAKVLGGLVVYACAMGSAILFVLSAPPTERAPSP